jgi:hypothetical protein
VVSHPHPMYNKRVFEQTIAKHIRVRTKLAIWLYC